MKNEQQNIEDLFKQKFEGYRIEPSTNLWNKIGWKLALKQFLKPGFKTFNIYYSSVFIGLIGTLAIYLTGNSSLGNSPELISESVQIDSIADQTNGPIATNDETKMAHVGKIETHQKPNSYSGEIISKQVIMPGGIDSTLLLIAPPRNYKPAENHVLDSSEIKMLAPETPKPIFTVASQEGCVPFELKINNLSINSSEYYWTFGDGNTSSETSPVHTYQYPGIYRIYLKATGPGGIAYSIIDSIIVHEKPLLKAYWPYDSEVLLGEKLAIACESQNVKRYEWSFGDGGIIRHKQPEYAYKSEGYYSIVLKGWSDKGCFDSLKIADVRVIRSDKKIAFPNAFCPNPDGPSSGKYYERETHNEIFHPIVKGKLNEYRLAIYAKSGALVFESTDVKTGWDGYYNNRLMPDGVYAYVVKGRFEGGEQFIQKGNVTVIRRK